MKRNDAVVIAAIGVPGSGKTTVLKGLAETRGYLYLCPDDIREELTGDPLDHSRNKEAWSLAFTRLEQAIRSGQSVVFDATQARLRDRHDFVNHARACGAARVIGAFAAVPLAVALEQNKRRERIVPDYAIERMHNFLQKDPPGVNEGFDALVPIEKVEEIL